MDVEKIYLQTKIPPLLFPTGTHPPECYIPHQEPWDSIGPEKLLFGYPGSEYLFTFMSSYNIVKLNLLQVKLPFVALNLAPGTNIVTFALTLNGKMPRGK